MAAKASLIFCAAALLVQSAYSACMGGIAGPYGFAGTGCGYNGFAGPGLGYEGFGGYGAGFDFGCGGVASTGGGLPCASASPIPPVGVSVLSENVYEGALAVGGNLPFLGTVAVEGVLPTAGAGAVSYGCGSPVGIAAEEGAIATGIAPHIPGTYGAYGGYGGYGGYGAYGAYGAGPAAAGWTGFGGLGYGAAGYGAGCGCGAIY